MRLKCDNRNLTQNQPKTILTAAIAAAATTLTVGSNDGLANNDYLLLGRIGEEKTEIVKIGASVVAGTSLTIGACVYSHDIDTPVTKIDYNQVRFYYGATNVAASSAALAAAQAIDPTEIYSYYEDTSNTTGYGFVRFYNSTTAGFSSYSDAINYSYKTGYTNRMLRAIRKNIRKKLKQTDEENSDFTNDEIDEEINLAQKEVAHDRMWSFYEKTKSFSSIANQYEYDLASDVFVLYDGKFDTEPLGVLTLHQWNQLRSNSDVTGDPTHICMWRRKARVYPYPSASASATAINDTDGITATDTTITVDSTSAFQTQCRIFIESEVISYTGKTSTTFTGCTRGEEGTTAATHADDITVTERDVIYHFQEDPDDLADETTETSIPDPLILVYKACAELTEGPTQDRFYTKYNIALKQLRKVDEPKVKSSFGSVRDYNSRILRNQNDYPTGLTGA